MTRPDDLLKIGSFAELAGTNLRTLRYYEELGLVQPALRSEGGFRYYRPSDVHRVRMIQNLQGLGLQLERIRELMSTRAQGLSPEEAKQRVGDALRAHGELVEEQMAALAEQQRKVREALEKLERCHGCEFHPHAANNFCEPCQNTGTSVPELLSALF